MSNRLRTALGVALAVGTASAQRPADDPIEFVAHCTFERDGAAALRFMCGFGAQDDARALFAAHAQAHGWSWEIERPGMADSGRSARCPGWLLDQFAGVGGMPCSSGDIYLERDVAFVLARNGRVSDALSLFDSALEEAKLRMSADDEIDKLAWVHSTAETESSYLSQWAAQTAARAGLWERALDFASGWTTTTDCGSYNEGEKTRMRLFRARCLVALGRCDEAAALAREVACNRGFGGGAKEDLIALWIECSLSTHRERDAEAALDAILSETPEAAHAACHDGLRSWQLRHMSREEQLAHLEELARFAPDTALALLWSSGSLEIVARLGAFEVIGGKLREPALARVLAETGHPDVGPAVEAASGYVLGLDYEFGIWTRANAQWNLLAVAR